MRLPVFFLLLIPLGCDDPAPPACPDCPDCEWPAALQPCDEQANPYRADPPVDIPRQWRIDNYGGGSCNHAAFAQVLVWQKQPDLAKWWTATYSGGEDAEGLGQKADKKGLRFAATYDGDVEFLEWCSRTRRGAAIHYYDNHAITFCGFAGDVAIVLNNNNTSNYTRIPKAEFIARWRGYGGKAITVVYDPPPPRPWVPLRRPKPTSF
ncbi:MAG TPA: hypothetical protein VM389_13105 [Phycisphaerae bacterium]|nr:hypothetical protein [Phycisphaerae bacterium]